MQSDGVTAMRDFKFRGREKESNKWVFGYARHWKCCYGDEWHIQGENDNVHVVIPETVGQYTGLKDCEGREIYEGDVVRIDDWSTPSYIRWDDDIASFVVDRWTINLAHVCYRKVIGNVHDNPQLLTLGGFEK